MYHNIISKILNSGNEPPEWMQVFKPGWIEIEGEGKALIDEKSFKEIQAYFKRRGNDLVVDYEHQTMKDVQAPAAGWIKDLRFNESGITARIDWTEKGAEYISKSEYRYHSPVFIVRKSDKRVIGLHSIALTNSPKTNNIKPILAKLNFKQENIMDLKKLISLLGLADDATEADVSKAIKDLKKKPAFPFQKKTAAKLNLDEEASMDDIEQAIENIVVAKEVIEALELEQDADTSTVIASIHALKKSTEIEVTPKVIADALDIKTGDTSEIVASIHALKAKTETMVSKADYEKLQQEVVARDASQAVKDALLEGKISKAQEAWAAKYAVDDLKGFQLYLTKVGATVPVHVLPTKTDDPKPVESKNIDNATKEIAAKMNISVDDLKKYGEVK